MAIMKSWGLPTDPVNVPIIGEIYFGDHTWVTADDKSCWNVLGGGPGFYCGENRWRGNTYIPPTITWRGKQVTGRELSSAPGESKKATCMGGKPGEFFGIPTYAGIIYGVHGVCHQMANRLLLTSGQTVAKADGFALSSANYGTYGTRVPPFVWSAAILFPAFAAALGTYVVGMNVAFGFSCANCGVPYPGPVASADKSAESLADERRLIAAVLDLHGVGKAAAAAPAANADGIASAIQANLEIHLRELDLLFAYISRGRVSQKKLEQLRESYAKYHSPPVDAIAAVASAMQAAAAAGQEATPAKTFDLERFAQEANRSVIEQQDKVADILGAADYELLFGAHPDVKIGVVNPAVLREAQP